MFVDGIRNISVYSFMHHRAVIYIFFHGTQSRADRQRNAPRRLNSVPPWSPSLKTLLSSISPSPSPARRSVQLGCQHSQSLISSPLRLPFNPPRCQLDRILRPPFHFVDYALTRTISRQR